MARKKRKLNSQADNFDSERIFRAGLYARLSVEDIRKKESDSIGTQMCLIRQYVEQQSDMIISREYEDVNQTGTNFERPGFNRMLEDIRAKKIDCVVVKDLSRFARNYIEAGSYLEEIFPFLGVRFVSICDNYDSLFAKYDDALLIPLKNIINEVYAREISKKVRSQYALKRKKGEFCGSFAPYGYIRDGHKLIIDEEAAVVVRRIFRLAIEGYSDNYIAGILNSEGVLPPNKHRLEQGVLKSGRYEDAKYWYKSTVRRITENRAYLGQLAQGRYHTNLMNGGVKVYIPENEWVITHNSHPEIISAETFEAVRNIRQKRKESRGVS